jgi:Na+/proline symporter
MMLYTYITSFAGKIREMALDLAFSVADYAIFGIMLFISFGIGVYHASKSSKNNEEFVMGSRSFSVLPMAISLCASFNSAYMILGIPGEIYSHGTQFYIMILGTGLGVFIAAELWLPILYRIQVVSIYEYFELRYKSKFPRILMTLIFIVKVCLLNYFWNFFTLLGRVLMY